MISRHRVAPALAVAVATSLFAGAAGWQVSASEVVHPDVVSEDPANQTPRLISDEQVLRPYANAIGKLGDTMYAGGLFGTVYDAQAKTNVDVNNFVVFDAGTGAVATNSPSIDDEVWAVETYGDSVYVGGEFGTVDGVSRPRLVKLNADGSVDQAFDARLRNGRVMDLHMYKGPAGPMLFVAGSSGKTLMALNPTTGADTGYLDLGIADKIPNAFGGLSVNNFAISPDGTKLVAVGNFTTVAGQPRSRAFMADLPAVPTERATLSDWYYPPFEETCRLTTARRLAYLTDVDFAPTGDYFVFGATGHIPAVGDLYKTVCDAAARFDTPVTPEQMRPEQPVWIQYTGGDTIWSVVATGRAVYVQGHFQYLNNPRVEGGGDANPLPGALQRLGIGALDPGTGAVLDWNPGKPAQKGGKQLLSTPDGLWVASDSRRFKGEPRSGIAFAPLL